MNHAQLDGVRLAYLDEGSGPPVLLLHGFTGTGRGDFAQMIEDLRRDHRVIAPDLRGYGASQPPHRDFPPDFYRRDALDAAALLDALRCGPAAVIGFSDGGESALLLAAERPDLARAVVSMGVCGVIAPAELSSVERWLPVESWGPDRAAWRDEIVAAHGEAQFKPMIEGWVAAARAIAAAGGDIALGSAHRIACPVLLINGELEVGNPLEDAQRLASAIANCRLEIVPGAGHGVHWERPERVRELVRGFLAEVEGGAEVL